MFKGPWRVLSCISLGLFLSLTAQSQKPNFVVIMADDCTLWDLGAYGSRDAITPNIDRLAAEGMRMNRCYQAAPMCSPTRHNLLTGLSPVKSGAYPNHTYTKDSVKSVVHYLGDLGYRVGFSGKRHINPPAVFPFEYLGKEKNPQFHLVDRFLKESKVDQNPFALFLMSNEPHTPWNKGDTSLFDGTKISLPPNLVDTKETRNAYVRYLAEINYLDAQVGQAMDLIKKYGFDKNTLVIFLSEQGAQWPFAKWTLYEAGVRSAMIAWMPDQIEARTASNALVEYQDILPTLIEMAGGTPPEILDGNSLLPIFRNPVSTTKKYSFSIQTTRGINSGSDHFGIRAVVDDQYRYIWNLTPEASFLNAVNNKGDQGSTWYQSWVAISESDSRASELISRYKYRPGEEELYRVATDKWCQKNLANDPSHAQVKKKLRAELLKWMEATGDSGQATEMMALERMWKNRKNK